MSEQQALLWQLDMTWNLFELLAAGLTDEECLREPSVGAWTIRPGPGGVWRADWADDEPHPAPAASVGWLMWHIGWWWSDVCGRAFGSGGLARDDARWPGSADAAIAAIHTCHERWVEGVSGLSQDALASVPLGDRCWPLTGYPFAFVVAWVNSELMKNAAEIGATLRILRS